VGLGERGLKGRVRAGQAKKRKNENQANKNPTSKIEKEKKGGTP